MKKNDEYSNLFKQINLEEGKVVTQEKRLMAMNKILNLVEEEFENMEVTAMFIVKLLKDLIVEIENKSLSVTIKNLRK